MRPLTALLLLWTISACTLPDGPQADSNPDVERFFERLRSETAQVVDRNENSPVHGFGYSKTIDVWDRPVGVEQFLLDTGRPAKDRLLAALREPVPHPLYTATYLRALSAFRDKSAAEAAAEVLGRCRDERVVTECYRVIALSGDSRYRDSLKADFGKPGSRLKRLLWALAMLGDRKASDDFLTTVEALVRVRPLAPPGGVVNPLPEVPSAEAFAHVLQSDDPIPMTADLTEDLTEVSHLGDPRSVRILIEALSSHRKIILDTSEFLLQRILALDLQRQKGVPWRDPGALYTLRLYGAMVRWWDATHDRLKWDPVIRKFSLTAQ